MDKLKAIAGKVLKVIGWLLIVVKYAEVARQWLIKAGDALDNGKLDDSFKG